MAARVMLVAMPNGVITYDIHGQTPHLGLVSLAGNLDPRLGEVRVVELARVRDQASRVFRRLVRLWQPHVVGLSSMTFQASTALTLARMVKAISPQTMVLMGGYHPTMMARTLLDQGPIDGVIAGEGEAAFSRFMEEFQGKKRWDQVPGLTFRADGVIIEVPKGPLLDPSQIALPDRGARVFTKGFHGFGIPMDMVETSRGCTMGCHFCSIQQMYGNSVRFFPLDRVLRDLHDARARGASFIFLADDNVTLDPDRFGDLCDAIAKAGLNDLVFATEASVVGLHRSPHLPDRMAKANFRFVFLGIERFQKDHLSFLGKMGGEEQTRETVGRLRSLGIAAGGGFILGNPDDDRESIRDLFQLAKSLPIDAPFFYMVTPYPGTQIRQSLIDQGLVTSADSFDDYDGLTAVVRTKHLTTEELSREWWRNYQEYFDASYLRFSLMRKNFPDHFRRQLAAAAKDTFHRGLMRLRGYSEEDLFQRDMALERDHRRLR